MNSRPAIERQGWMGVRDGQMSTKGTTYDRMNRKQRAKLRDLCLQVECPYCGSAPRVHCRGAAGKKAKPHWGRRRAFSAAVISGPDFHITTPNKMESNIPETDITRNFEQSSLNRLFPCSRKVFTPEDVTERLENIESLLRIILDRLSAVDGKRIRDEVAPFGYGLQVIEKSNDYGK